MATQTPLLVTLLRLTASQIDGTKELKANAKRSRTLPTTTITDIPTLLDSSVQTLLLINTANNTNSNTTFLAMKRSTRALDLNRLNGNPA